MAHQFSLMIFTLRILERDPTMNKIKMPLTSLETERQIEVSIRVGSLRRKKATGRNSSIRHLKGGGKTMARSAIFTKEVTDETPGVQNQPGKWEARPVLV